MTIWSGEIKELDKLYASFKGELPEIVKEMEQLIRTDDPNVVMLYSRRCLEVIVTDLCEIELQRPRKTEPLKGIIDKLNSEEKVPSHIITSMISLNSMATYGTHPKDFDPEQVKPVLNNLAIIIRWYLKYKDFQIVSKTESKEQTIESKPQEHIILKAPKSWKSKKGLTLLLAGLFLVIVIFVIVRNLAAAREKAESLKYMSINSYKTVKINGKVWMAEDLKTTRFNDGTPIPQVKDNKEWEKLTTPAFCWYKNDKSNMATYGALYNWFAVNTENLCPVGWHVASAAEWTTLNSFLGDSLPWLETGDTILPIKKVAAIKLKEAGNAHWIKRDSSFETDETGRHFALTDSIYGTDEYGFTALPGGSRSIYGGFFGIGEEGYWWSSTPDYNKSDAKDREMFNYNNELTDIQQYKQFGMSVRCIKN